MIAFLDDSEWFAVGVAAGGVVLAAVVAAVVARAMARRTLRAALAAGESDVQRAGRFAFAHLLVDLHGAARGVEPNSSLGTVRAADGDRREIFGYGPDDRVRALVDLAVGRARDVDLDAVAESLEAELAKWEGGLERWNVDGVAAADESEAGGSERRARDALAKTIKARDAFGGAVHEALTIARDAIHHGSA